jgi:diguanylate cyclase (GGDEF)-like protein
VTGAPSIAEPAEARARERRGVASVVALTGAMLAASTVLLWFAGDVTVAAVPTPWWAWFVIGVGFTLAERFVFHVEFRREAIAISLGEVPTALALAFLSPVAAIVVRPIGAIVPHLTTPRRTPYKVAFNLALFVFETALAFAIVRTVQEPGETTGGTFLVAVVFGTGFATIVGGALVAIAVSAFEGEVVRRLRRQFQRTFVVGSVSALVASVALAPALFGFHYAALSLVPIACVWLVFIGHGRLAQRHSDLEAVHDFSSIAGGSLVLDEVASTSTTEVARLLRSGAAALRVFRRDGSLLAEATTGDGLMALPDRHSDERWGEALALGAASWCTIGSDGAVSVDRSSPSDHLVVCLRDGGTTIGALVVGPCVSAAGVFTTADLQRADALAAQLSVALARATLHADMEHAANHDSLTGDLNRAAFGREVTAALVMSRAASAVLLLDLDQFKEVNDTLGHHVGDRVLVEFASRVRGVIDGSDVFARFGGDEFALFAHRRDMAAIRTLADRILSVARAPFELDGLQVVVNVSIGIAFVTDDDRDDAALVRRADIAMYAAKREHAGSLVYAEELDRRTPERLSLLGDLRDALDLGEIEVHLQPKIDLASQAVVGVEALARWHHPARGWVPPSDFIVIAEQTGLVRQLTDRVLDASLRLARGWAEAGYDIPVSVNLSTLDLLDELVAERVAHRLEQHGLAPDRLVLEITESSLMVDSPRTTASIERLDRLGVPLSLDDFGTGYSSLSYLRRLPVSELKIDRSFVTGLVIDPQDDVIVGSIVELGHRLGLRVVAEGIENEPTMSRLAKLGCDQGQGYAIARPLSPEHFERWLAAGVHRVRSLPPTTKATVRVLGTA